MKSLITTLIVIGLILLSLSCAKRNVNPSPVKADIDPYRDIVPFGPDTYSISLSSVWGYSKARTVVYRKASDFCQSRNQIFMPNIEKSRRGSCTLIFRCLNEGDPELVRPKWEWDSEPDIDIRIEDGRK